MNTKFDTIIYEIKENIAYIKLNRPDIRNAFNEIMINELIKVFEDIEKRKEIMAVILTGEGESFCSGADLNWMKKMINYSYEENIKDSLELSELFYKIYTLSKPVIARINGSAIGGGVGLIVSCDFAIAVEDAKFGLSEVKLGLVPACISPYLIRRCGEGNVRWFILTGERIDAKKAKEIRIIDEVVKKEELDNAVNKILEKLLTSGRDAIKMCKELIKNVNEMKLEDAKIYTAEAIAKMRIGEEAQEGMRAFLEKRKPKWSK